MQGPKRVAETVHLKEIGAQIATKTGLTKKDMGVIVDALCLGMIDAITEDCAVYLPGIGRFLPHRSPARTARNPRTGAPADVPARRVVKFRASALLKREVDKKEM